MAGEKPVWQDNIKCFHCGACLNYCPMQSAQIKSYTEKNGRYSHPYATIEDIAMQKISKALKQEWNEEEKYRSKTSKT